MSEAKLSLAQLVQQMQTVNFNTVAAATLLAFETGITANQELTHIWRSRWSLVKVLYILARYPALIYLLMNAFVLPNPYLSHPFCNHYVLFQIWGAWSFLPVTDALVVIRIFAIYERRKKMGVFLFLLWLAETSCSVILLAMAFRGFNAIPNFLPGVFTGCLTLRTPIYKLALSFWGVASGFQAICVTITLYKLVGIVQDFGFRSTPMVNIFFRDGALYFLVILSSDLLNTFLERYASLFLQEASLMWAVCIFSIASCRMVLNLRDLAAPSSLSMMDSSVNDTGVNMNVINIRRRRPDTKDSGMV